MNPAECPAGRAAASVDGHVDRVGLIPPSLLPTCGVVIIHFLSDYELGQHSTRVQLLICKVFCLFGRQKLFYLAPSVLFQMWARIKVAPSAAAGPEH